MAKVKAVKAVAAAGGLGSGFLEETFDRALEDGATFIGCDGGSTDAGPYYLGSGKVKSPRASVKRDTRVILREALSRDLPVIIGTAGYSGGRPHLQWMLDIIRETARENNWHFKLAAIDCEIDKPTLLDAYRAGQLVPMHPTPHLDETIIQNAERFVAMMGVEPFQRALKAGAQVVVSGRTSDVSIYAALPILRGIPKAVAFHAGKILECGAACVNQRFYSDCMVAVLDEEGFTVVPPNSAMSCTQDSVASHTLYENGHPFHLLEPGGMVDTSEARYEAISDRAVRVTGSSFIPSDVYTVRLEGATRVGYRSVAFAGVDDPLVLRQLKGYLSGLRKVLDQKIRDSLELQPEQYTLNWRVYGRNGSVGVSEADDEIMDHRVGILIDAVAETQALASAVIAVAWHTGLHHPIPQYEGLVSNFAFSMSPPGIDVGPVYRFCINHLWKLSDPCAPFRMTIEDF